MENGQEQILNTFNRVLQLLMDGAMEEGIAILDGVNPETAANQNDSTFINNFKKFIQQYYEGANFINALAEGNLDIEPPRRNYVISHYKQLQSNLRHLTWQTQQIARGDYNQKVSYLGEFSIAFNQMTDALREKKMIEDQLRDLYATRDVFMSIISHDLRSPFNGILGFADLLVQDYDELSDQERKQCIENIQSSSQTAFDLLENLLEWSRIQTGKIQFTFEELNLNRVILENFMLLQSAADKKQIQLNNLAPPDCSVYADRNSTLTAIRNLLSNAIKFTPRGGKITVNALQHDTMWEISIADSGIGIKPENLLKLFVTGETVKTRGTENEKGTGLGLLLCKEFVEKNGGTIRAESTPGFGSVFFITLPGQKP
jgi:signal transduction histidine kinase